MWKSPTFIRLICSISLTNCRTDLNISIAGSQFKKTGGYVFPRRQEDFKLPDLEPKDSIISESQGKNTISVISQHLIHWKGVICWFWQRFVPVMYNFWQPSGFVLFNNYPYTFCGSSISIITFIRAPPINLRPIANSINLEFDDTVSVSENSSCDENFPKKEVSSKPNWNFCSFRIRLQNIL